MDSTDRRSILRMAGCAAPALMGAAIGSPAAAQVGSKGAVDEARAQEIIASVKPAVVLVEVASETGMSWSSGFFISSDGLLVTTARVVKDAQRITCIYRNREKLSARVLGVDLYGDLALLKADVGKPVPTVLLGDSSQVREGQLVAVSGYAEPVALVWLGMALDSSTSRGAVNAIRFTSDPNAYLGDGALQIDAPVAPGNAGGPVYRLDTGEVIGVLRRGIGRSDNTNFAVPINQVKTLTKDQGLSPKSAPVSAGSPEARVEPGDLKTLNTVSASRELPRLFGFGFPFPIQPQLTPRRDQAVRDWHDCTGQRPPIATPPTKQGSEMFFGCTDGRLYRMDFSTVYGGVEPLFEADDGYIFLYPPAVNERLICAAAGSLDLDQFTREKVDWKRTLIGGAAAGAFQRGVPGSVARIFTKKVVEIRLEGVGSLLGLNRRTGGIDWQVDTGFVGTPILHKDRVYYGGVGERGCIEAFTGKQIWKFNRRGGASADWYHIAMADDDKVVAIVVPIEGKKEEELVQLRGNGEARIECYQKEDGKLRWKADIGSVNNSYRPLSTAAFADQTGTTLFVLADQLVAAVLVSGGDQVKAKDRIKWSYDHEKALREEKRDKRERFPGLVGFTPSIAIHEGTIYVGTLDNKLFAFDGQNGSMRWSYNTYREVGQPAIHDGQVLVGSQDGYVHVLDREKGQLLWRVATNQSVMSQPLVHQGMLYAVTEQGTVFSVRMPIA